MPRATNAYREACQAIGAGVQVIVYLAAALVIAWHVSIAAVAVGALLLFALRGFVRRSRAAGDEQTRLTRSLTGRLVDDGICETLVRLRGQFTIVAISHQPAQQKAADLVYVLAGGAARRMIPRAAPRT